MTPGRILIVSNRQPITALAVAEGVHLAASGGGLATGLSGWPGDTPRFSPALRSLLAEDVAAS